MPDNQDKDTNNIITPGIWSRTGFSFSTTLSVALLISRITGSWHYDFIFLINALVLSLFFSVYYFINSRTEFKSSYRFWNKTELASYLIFLVLSGLVLITISAELIIAASTAGLFLLVITDHLHSLRGARTIFLFHSGQNLPTALIIASFFSELRWPFLFIALIKLISAIYYGCNDKSGISYFSVRVMRIAMLFTAGASLITEISWSDPVITVLFLGGELVDRINYYHDLENKYK